MRSSYSENQNIILIFTIDTTVNFFHFRRLTLALLVGVLFFIMWHILLLACTSITCD